MRGNAVGGRRSAGSQAGAAASAGEEGRPRNAWQGVWVTMHIHILLSRYGSYRIYVNYNIYVL